MLSLKSKLTVLCAVLVAVPLALPAPAAADVPSEGALYTNGPSGRYLLDGTWYRRSDRRDRGLEAGFQRTRALAGWRAVTVPDAANAGDTSARSYLGGVHWYRKDFEAPAGSATNWVLRFESVNFRATVWLNGRRLGPPHGRVPAVRARGQGRAQGDEPARRARRQPPHRGGHSPARRARRGQVRGRLVELRGHPARGLPAAGRHVRLRERVRAAAPGLPDVRRTHLRARRRREHGAPCRPAPR